MRQLSTEERYLLANLVEADVVTGGVTVGSRITLMERARFCTGNQMLLTVINGELDAMRIPRRTDNPYPLTELNRWVMDCSSPLRFVTVYKKQLICHGIGTEKWIEGFNPACKNRSVLDNIRSAGSYALQPTEHIRFLIESEHDSRPYAFWS